jgi:hypothetical protein
VSEDVKRYGDAIYVTPSPYPGFSWVISRYDRCSRCGQQAAFDLECRKNERVPEDAVHVAERMPMMATIPDDEKPLCSECSPHAVAPGSSCTICGSAEAHAEFCRRYGVGF